MPRHDVYLTNEDEELLNELCKDKHSKSGCIKEIIRKYYQLQKEQKRESELDKKIDEILMILKQNNTRQSNPIDSFMKKGK